MAGSTPIFGFPYPDPSDLVANYPALGQQLAENVEDAIYARKILQIVRNTDATQRTTTSTSFVDVTGMSVTITPQNSNNTILLFAVFDAGTGSSDRTIGFQITDSANTAISGAELCQSGSSTILYQTPYNLIAYATPATTSAVTYKLRFRAGGAGTAAYVYNNEQTGQMYAIEVSA